MHPVPRAVGLLTAIITYCGPALAAPTRQPTGKWVVNYASDQCLLSRNYGDDAHPLTLVFEKLPISENIGLYIIKRSGRLDWNSGKAVIVPASHDPNPPLFGAYTTKSSLRMIALRIDDSVVAAAAKEGTFTVRVRGETDDSLAVPNLNAAFHALDDCALDLGRSWGIPVEQQRQIVKPARMVGGLDKVFSSNDYPEAAESRGESGRIKVRVGVDQQGQATSCTLTRPSGSKSLDEATCRILTTRARYEPALDGKGRPVPSLYVTTISWVIEG